MNSTFLDTRLNHMPFLGSPLPMAILIFGYLFMIRNGKKLMENRQPMKIDGIIIAYNLVQIFFSSAPMFVVKCFANCRISVRIKN